MRMNLSPHSFIMAVSTPVVHISIHHSFINSWTLHARGSVINQSFNHTVKYFPNPWVNYKSIIQSHSPALSKPHVSTHHSFTGRNLLKTHNAINSQICALYRFLKRPLDCLCYNTTTTVVHTKHTSWDSEIRLSSCIDNVAWYLFITNTTKCWY